MLIKCPECELQVSDKAKSCPHCGYPLKKDSKYKPRPNGHKKLPNGFGQISEIKNTYLRNRFRAMVTVGTNSKGRPICKLLKPQAYFKTYNEAYTALVEYNKNPYDLDIDITVKELYDKWTDEKFNSYSSETSIRNIKSAWGYCEQLYDMRAKDIRPRHIKGVMSDGTKLVNGKEVHPSAYTAERIKSMFNMMFDYALENEIVNINYARSFDVPDNIVSEAVSSKRNHIAYRPDEFTKLLENINDPFIGILAYQCLSGWRPRELCELLVENVDLDKNIVVGGMKTANGRNRPVPIHPAVRSVIEYHYANSKTIGSKYLFNFQDAKTHKNNSRLTYDKLAYRYTGVVDRLGLNASHRPHDGRKHFITMAKKYNLDEYAIKYLVGHSVNDLTEKVYTERDIEWLRDEIAKIEV